MNRSPGGPVRPKPALRPPRVGSIAGVTGDALAMGSAAPILLWFVAACRLRAWSARRSRALVRVRPSAATPAGAGGSRRRGALGRAACGSSCVPPPRVAGLSGGGGASPRLRGGGGSALLRPAGRGGSEGEAGPLRRSPPPCPVGCRPAILCLRRAPQGYTRAGGVAGWPWASGAPRAAASGSVRRGGGERGGVISSPWFAPPPSPGLPLSGPLRWRCPGRRRSVAGR